MYVLSPLLPKFTEAKAVVKFLDGKSVSDISDLLGKIKEQTGNPRNPVNFSNPDIWIKKLLKGKEQKLASELWEGGNKQANPRYLQRVESFSVWSKFLQSDDIYSITDKGKKFVADDNEVTKSVDTHEGIYLVLKAIKEKGSCKKADLLDPWTNFLNKRGSRISTDSVIRLSLWYRLSNLLNRKLTERKGFRYSLTDEGKNYLSDLLSSDLKLKKHDAIEEKIDEVVEEALDEVLNDQQSIIDTIEVYNKSVLEDFQNKLLKMHFVKFEHFIGKLLTAMGYSVEVTKPVGDGGIDIVAKSESGLIESIEVFQVKRTMSTIGLPLITSLRGAMENYRTSLGGFVTLGNYARNIEETIAEENKTRTQTIKLINGEKLLELAAQYGVGITKAKVEYEIYEIDSEIFD